VLDLFSPFLSCGKPSDYDGTAKKPFGQHRKFECTHIAEIQIGGFTRPLEKSRANDAL
jgi:hypothetical protein